MKGERQVLGIFGRWSPDIYAEGLRINHAIGSHGTERRKTSVLGHDLMLSVPPLSPDWLKTQAIFTEKDTPLGSVGALDSGRPPARVSSSRKRPSSPVVPPG